MEQMTLTISGMSCGGCVTNVRKALGAIPSTRVDAVAVGSATVSYDASRTTPAAIAQAVRDAGYELATDGVPVAVGAVADGCCGGGPPARKRGGCC